MVAQKLLKRIDKKSKKHDGKCKLTQIFVNCIIKGIQRDFSDVASFKRFIGEDISYLQKMQSLLQDLIMRIKKSKCVQAKDHPSYKKMFTMLSCPNRTKFDIKRIMFVKGLDPLIIDCPTKLIKLDVILLPGGSSDVRVGVGQLAWLEWFETWILNKV